MLLVILFPAGGEEVEPAQDLADDFNSDYDPVFQHRDFFGIFRILGDLSGEGGNIDSKYGSLGVERRAPAHTAERSVLGDKSVMLVGAALGGDVINHEGGLPVHPDIGCIDTPVGIERKACKGVAGEADWFPYPGIFPRQGYGGKGIPLHPAQENVPQGIAMHLDNFYRSNRMLVNVTRVEEPGIRRDVGGHMVGGEEIPLGVKKEAGSGYSERGGLSGRGAVEKRKDGLQKAWR